MKVAVIMGSGSDFAAVKPAADTLKDFGVGVEVRVISAHRTPDEAAAFSKGAREGGFGVIIAAAGKAAHLAGVLAAHTTLPVIGIPIQSSGFGGLDALLSTVQMPAGIPVAAVAVDGAVNAALLALEILAVSDSAVASKLSEYRQRASENVVLKDGEIRALY